ncbi:hypothetical protein Patl1_27804 [Pistacia atlantica]|uniref:Uncharacterized protein n=1 Tax=Pistacia atlantica TaxID=434234 RepID=A0ACC1BEA9_9ROSI|nr:hypothetical protein Patl1_27804 [Pistacia atlantica]
MVFFFEQPKVIWQSFDSPTDTILGGQRMKYSQLISSRSITNHSSGIFYLNVTDYGLAAYSLNLSLSGTLQLTKGNKTLQAIANSSYSATNKTVMYRATLDADGILRLYAHRFDINGNSNVTIEWRSFKATTGTSLMKKVVKGRSQHWFTTLLNWRRHI